MGLRWVLNQWPPLASHTAMFMLGYITTNLWVNSYSEFGRFILQNSDYIIQVIDGDHVLEKINSGEVRKNKFLQLQSLAKENETCVFKEIIPLSLSFEEKYFLFFEKRSAVQQLGHLMQNINKDIKVRFIDNNLEVNKCNE